MKNQERIEDGQYTIYHELGHVFGYCLSYRVDSTNLGRIKQVAIGLQENRIMPLDVLYHFDSSDGNHIQVQENTKNVSRTIAWFIEVILGCTFQTLFVGKEFKDCFSVSSNHGNIDYNNIMRLRNYSSFQYTIEDIYDLQSDVEAVLIKYNIIASFVDIANDIKQTLLNDISNQIFIRNAKLDNLLSSINKLISPEILTDYKNILNKYTV